MPSIDGHFLCHLLDNTTEVEGDETTVGKEGGEKNVQTLVSVQSETIGYQALHRVEEGLVWHVSVIGRWWNWCRSEEDCLDPKDGWCKEVVIPQIECYGVTGN